MCAPALSEASSHLSWDLAIAREAPAEILALQSQTPPDITSAYRKAGSSRQVVMERSIRMGTCLPQNYTALDDSRVPDARLRRRDVRRLLDCGLFLMKSESHRPMTLGNAAAARVWLVVWCLDCGHQVDADPAEMAERYGAETTCQTGATS
jgi:hypothetical protein